MNIGILGGSPLAMLLGQTARAMAHGVRVMDPDPALSPARLVSEYVQGAFDDTDALEVFVTEAAVITIDSVRIPSSALLYCSRTAEVAPPINALECAQDRLKMKKLAEILHIPTAGWYAVESAADVEEGCARIGLPGMLVRRMSSSDDRSPAVFSRREQAMAAWSAERATPWMVEQFIPADREICCMVARGKNGQIVTYPFSELFRTNGRMHRIIAPAQNISPAVSEGIAIAMSSLVDTLQHVGIFSGTFIVNNDGFFLDGIHPTVHISGLWTSEGCRTNQYENHVRTITGEELGDAALTVSSKTVRLFGPVPPALKTLHIDGLTVHPYGIDSANGNVSTGHVTLTGMDRMDFEDRWKKLCKTLGIKP